MIAAELFALARDVRRAAAPAAELEPRWERIAARLGPAAPGAAAPLPDGVAGAPCPQEPRVFHSGALRTIDWADSARWNRLRVEFHLRQLGHLLDPSDPRFAPRVSVVIPVRNGREFVGRALDSCFAQHDPSLEVIVVDDGSTDGTAEIAERHAAGALLLRQDPAGVAAARNAGLARASGDFVQFLDADDELLPGALRAKLAALGRVPDAQLCYSHYRAGPAGPAEDWVQAPLDGPLGATMDTLHVAAGYFPFQASTVLVARWFVDRAGGFDPQLRQAEDGRCWIRMALAGLKPIALSEPTAVRHLRPASLTRARAESLRWSLESAFLSLADLAAFPALSRYVAVLLGRVDCLFDEAARLGLAPAEVARLRARLLDFEGGVGALGGSASSGPTNVLLRWRELALTRRLTRTAGPARAALEEQRAALRRRIEHSAGIAAADLCEWLPPLDAQPFDRLGAREQVTLSHALTPLYALAGAHALARSRVADVAAAWPGHPFERPRRRLLGLLRRLTGT